MEDSVKSAWIKWLADIVLHEAEMPVAIQMLDVLTSSSQQVVDAQYRVSPFEQRIAKMRPEKARPARHQYLHISPIENRDCRALPPPWPQLDWLSREKLLRVYTSL
jgi:hypothetical protein